MMFLKYRLDQIMISIPQPCALQYHRLWYVNSCYFMHDIFSFFFTEA